MAFGPHGRRDRELRPTAAEKRGVRSQKWETKTNVVESPVRELPWHRQSWHEAPIGLRRPCTDQSHLR